MKISKKSTNHFERILIALIAVQIFFFFIPIYEFSAGVAYIKFIDFSFGLYSLAFGINYGIQSTAGNIMWLAMLALPVISMLVVICTRKNLIIRYGLPAVISLAELIGIKLVSSGLDTQAQTILMNIRSSEIIQTANKSAAKMQNAINAYGNTKICQNCGAAISSDAEFCSKCGEKYVAPAERVCPSCGAVITGDDMFCRKCGAKYEDSVDKTRDVHDNRSSVNDESICPDCGAPVRLGAKFCKKCGRAMDV